MTEQRTWKGVVFIAASVDGFIALPDGDLAWLTDPPPEPRHVPAWSGEDAPQGYEDFSAGVSHLVMGRGTYDKVLTFGFWPYEKFRVLVLSTTLTEAVDPRITVFRSITEARELLILDTATHVYVDGGQCSPTSYGTTSSTNSPSRERPSSWDAGCRCSTTCLGRSA